MALALRHGGGRDDAVCVGWLLERLVGGLHVVGGVCAYDEVLACSICARWLYWVLGICWLLVRRILQDLFAIHHVAEVAAATFLHLQRALLQ